MGQTGEAKSDIKILNVAKDDKSEAVSPAKLENVMSGKYPISRALNQYLNGKPTAKLLEFMQFQIGAVGQEIVKKQGFFPVKADWMEFNRRQGL